MADVRKKRQPVYGSMVLGYDKISQSLVAAITAAPNYTRTPMKSGQVLGNRSAAKYYHGDGVRHPYYGASQVFTCTEWDNGDGSGYRGMPIERTTPNNGQVLLAFLKYDQPASIQPFTRGEIHVSGIAYAGDTSPWSVTLIAADSANNLISVGVGGFDIVQAVDTQTLANLNSGLYPAFPGAAEGLKAQFSQIDYIAFAFYK